LEEAAIRESSALSEALEELNAEFASDAYHGDEYADGLSETGVSFSRDDWNLILINKTHPIPDDYEFNLGTIRGDLKADLRIIPALLEMLKTASEDGVNLTVCSPYRDSHRQETLFESKLNSYTKQGESYLDAYRLSAQYVTVPGASEHEAGLALDIVSPSYQSLNEGFGQTQAGVWLAQNSYKFGFILRYPAEKESVTGISYEPWHFRYVGAEAAKLIFEQNLTLEEFCATLE